MSDEKGNLILLAEDDYLQRLEIVSELGEYGTVRPVGSESEFNQEVGILGMGGQLPLRLAVIDLMMLEERRPIVDVDVSQRRINHLRDLRDASKLMRCDQAGWRCYSHLRASERQLGQNTPVIIYSVLQLGGSREYLEGLRGGRGMYRSIGKNSDPSHIQYVEKGMTHDKLHAAVRRALGL